MMAISTSNEFKYMLQILDLQSIHAWYRKRAKARYSGVRRGATGFNLFPVPASEFIHWRTARARTR